MNREILGLDLCPSAGAEEWAEGPDGDLIPAPNASPAAWRSSMISAASTAGSGRLSESSGDSSRTQVMSSFGLPL